MEGTTTPIVVNEGDHQDLLSLPPGFRFHPMDAEIIDYYLTPKVVNNNFTATAIGEVDLNKCEPWDLPKKAKMGEKEWYFFCQRDRKYPTGMRTNRATESGYWKATGKDKEIYSIKGKVSGGGGGGGGGSGSGSSSQQQLVGMKKTLVFYKGRAPKGEKSNWVMHEFRLEGKLSYYNFPKSAKDEWVVCKVFHKNTGMLKFRTSAMPNDLSRINSFVEGLLDSPNNSLPPLMDSPISTNNNNTDHDNDFKGPSIPSSSSTRTNSDVNSLFYFPTTNQLQMQHQQLNQFAASGTSTNYQMMPNSMYANFPYGYLNQPSMTNSIPKFSNYQQFRNDQAITRECKVEQFSSNQSVASRSQDTGLSTDLTAEISSKVVDGSGSKPAAYEDMEGPTSSVGPLSDLDCFWNYED